MCVRVLCRLLGEFSAAGEGTWHAATAQTYGVPKINRCGSSMLLFASNPTHAVSLCAGIYDGCTAQLRLSRPPGEVAAHGVVRAACSRIAIMR